jgi:hypothetical protein
LGFVLYYTNHDVRSASFGYGACTLERFDGHVCYGPWSMAISMQLAASQPDDDGVQIQGGNWPTMLGIIQ